MPDRFRRAVAGVGLAVALGVAVAPAAVAQTGGRLPTWEERWAGSTLDRPTDTVRTDPFEVSGTMRFDKRTPADQIARLEVRLVDDPADDVQPAEGCTLPAPAVVEPAELQTEPVAELPFSVELGGVPCNGAYRIEVEARTNDPTDGRYVLGRPVAVGLLPAGIDDVEVTLDDRARAATVTFNPLAPEQLAPDAIGYVVERGGPASEPGAGEFVDIGTLDLDDEPHLVDDLSRAPGGTYTYRVRATRAGAVEPERSSVLDTATATLTIDDPPDGPPSTAATPGRRRAGRAGTPAARGTPSPRRSTTATTVDTGFEGTIDYGDLPEGSDAPDLPGDEPVAGASTITEEDEEGVDLAAPVAGALVLVGWAGHIAYLNRLAKQL